MTVEDHLSVVTIPTERGVFSENPLHAVVLSGKIDVNHSLLGNVQQWFPLAFRRIEMVYSIW